MESNTKTSRKRSGAQVNTDTPAIAGEILDGIDKLQAVANANREAANMLRAFLKQISDTPLQIDMAPVEQ